MKTEKPDKLGRFEIEVALDDLAAAVDQLETGVPGDQAEHLTEWADEASSLGMRLRDLAAARLLSTSRR